MKKHLIAGLCGIIVGTFLFMWGASALYFAQSQEVLTDQDIIERAKDLGMIELKEAISPKKEE